MKRWATIFLVLTCATLAWLAISRRRPRSAAEEVRTAGSDPEQPGDGPRASRRPPPPRYTNETKRAPIQNDPLRPGYDSAKLLQAAEVDPRKIFGAEPRDDSWAPAAEQTLRSGLERDLAATGVPAEIRNMECRTATCRVVIQADSDGALRRANRLMYMTNVADGLSVTGPAGPPEKSMEYFMTFSAAHHDLRANEDYFARKRRTLLTLARKNPKMDPTLI